MGEKRKRGLHSIPPNVPTLSKHRDNPSKTPTEIITISSDEDEPQPKRPNQSPVELESQAKFGRAPTEPDLCPEQQALVDLILSGRNVFYTGSAGTGKSTVLKAFVQELRARNKTVNIIAPTGRAALDINGQTFWTYAGWTPLHMKKKLKELKEAAHGKFVSARLRKTDVLVIDEISMVENHHFERLNVIMKEARKSEAAFGGVQLVVTGDFCQLPPVKPFTFCIQCGRELIKQMGGSIHKCPQHGE
jgi:ATP-dependent DNA helicase PIF1